MPMLTARVTDAEIAALRTLAKSRNLSVTGLVLSLLEPGAATTTPAEPVKPALKAKLARMTAVNESLTEKVAELTARLAARPSGPTTFGRPAPAEVPEVYIEPQAVGDRRTRQQRTDAVLQKAFPQRARPGR